jgi:hypothetical protein
MNKQTAVEWFIEKTIESGHLWVTDTPSDMTELGKLIEQAKQIERDQIIDAWENGIDNCGEFNTPTVATGIQYYNETFKKD